MPITLNEIRDQYPQYNDLSDQQLADSFHSRYYSDMDKNEFYSKISFNPVPEITDVQAESLAELARRKDLGSIRDLMNNLFAPVEVGLTMATGAVAEPMAGMAGIAKTITSGPEEATKTIEEIRDYFTYRPETEEGQKLLENIGEKLSSVTSLMEKAESGLGEMVFEATGSPTLVSAATTMPTVIMELLGAGLLKGSEKTLRGINKALKSRKVLRDIERSVPTIDMLKDVARGLYKEIDDLGAVINPESYKSFVKNITKVLQKQGLDPEITPKSYKALNRIYDKLESDITTTDLDTLRKIAKNAIDPNNPAESNLSRIITESIDDFMDDSSKNILSSTGDAKDIGTKYKIARDLWGRARRSELLQEAFAKANLASSGFETGIRNQFRSILNNKKQRKFFQQNELDEMKKVVKGVKGANLFRLIGKLGFSETGQGLIGGSIGAGFGAYVGGPAGAIAIPVIGIVSRKFAKRLTAKGAEFADQVIRAGKDANKIATAYLKNTPSKLRDPAELAQLLMRNDIELTRLPKTSFMQKAIDIATDYRSILAESIALTESIKATQEEGPYPPDESTKRHERSYSVGRSF